MREKSRLKVRQPLQKILVPVRSDAERREIEHMRDVILEEVNVRELECVDHESPVVKRTAKPNFRSLGTKYGKNVQRIAAHVRSLRSEDLGILQSGGELTAELDGAQFRLTQDDVEILHEDIPGWLIASQGPTTVALDTTVTEELKLEGIAREFVNRVQNLRKDSGFDVTDRIRLYVAADGAAAAAVERHASYIREETLAREVVALGSSATAMQPQEFDVNGEQVRVAVEKI